MAIDPGQAPVPGEPAEAEATPRATDATVRTEGEEGPTDQSHLVPSWVRIALGILVLVVLAFLVYPSLQQGLIPGQATPSSSQEQAAAIDSQADQAHYDVAAEYYQTGRYEDVWAELRAVSGYAASVQSMPEIAQAEKAVQEGPNDKEAHFKLGTVWARAELLQLAEVAFKQAIALDNRYVDAYINLGVVYYQLSRLTDALAQYDAALAIAPDDADIHHNRGAVYVQQALENPTPDPVLLDKGAGEFKRALELNPNLPQAYFSLGVVYDLRGQAEEAIAMFKHFQELDDGSDPQATEAAKTYLDKLGK
jgi:tetratricopeptide (TPR) repeat protein